MKKIEVRLALMGYSCPEKYENIVTVIKYNISDRGMLFLELNELH